MKSLRLITRYLLGILMGTNLQSNIREEAMISMKMPNKVIHQQLMRIRMAARVIQRNCFLLVKKNVNIRSLLRVTLKV
jgi:hypothetical protein